MNDITLENFTKLTGHRFRATKEQLARIAANTLTREQALAEFVATGGLDRLSQQKTLPPDFFTDPTLTLDNYSERVKVATGRERRFRMPATATARGLSREQAFAEFVETQRAGVTHV